MGGIKYYQLAKGEELPDEFCAVRDVGGEPSEYTFYAPEAANAKLREQMERLVTLLRNDCDIDASWDGLRKFWSIGLTEDGCLMRDRACKAEAENAKLRELLEVVLQCAGETKRDKGCDACPMYNGPWRNDGTWCLLRPTLRELVVTS